MSHPIDGHEEMELDQQRLQAIVETILDGVITIDEAGIMESVNPAACRLFGYGAEEMVGRNVSMLMPAPHAERHDDYLRRYLEEGTPRIIGIGREVEGVRKDGSRFPLDLAVNEMPFGERRRFVGVLRDLTEAEAARGYLKSAHDAGKGLLWLINDILDFSKIEAGRLELERGAFELAPLVEEVVELLAGRARAKGIALAALLDPGLPRRVEGDAGRLRQILINLVGNAVKFTAEGGVEVAVAVVGGEIRFDVVDSGIGIPEAARERLFKEFFQADSTYSRQFGGTGLGLAISKRLVELMEGSIGVESVPREGSDFWFRLPLPPVGGERLGVPEGLPERVSVAPAVGGGRRTAGASGRGGRILLAEEGLIDTRVVRQLEEDTGAAVVPRMMAIYFKETRGRLARIGEAADRGDLAVLEGEAHALKSSSGTMGATALAARARALEAAAREGRSADALRLSGEMAALVEASISRLGELCGVAADG